jgi:hypothetical protein
MNLQVLEQLAAEMFPTVDSFEVLEFAADLVKSASETAEECRDATSEFGVLSPQSLLDRAMTYGIPAGGGSLRAALVVVELSELSAETLAGNSPGPLNDSELNLLSYIERKFVALELLLTARFSEKLKKWKIKQDNPSGMTLICSEMARMKAFAEDATDDLAMVTVHFVNHTIFGR